MAISGDGSNPRVSIIIPTYTRSDKLRACLASVIEYTTMEETEVLVVANGASEETKEIAEVYREFPVTLLWFPEPLGYPKACNAGIKASTGEYVVLLNDDAELLPQPKNEWIEKLLKPMLEDELVGLTGPLKEHDPNSGHDFIIFFCVMIRREVFDSIGLLDEIFSPYFGEDTDFSIRAEKVGWKSVRVPEDVPTKLADIDPNTTTIEAWKHDKIHTGSFGIWHDAESTIGRLPESEDILRRNRLILKERYGNKCPCLEPQEGKTCEHGLKLYRANVIDGWFNIDEGHQLAQWVSELPEGAKVLSVGAWHGRSSRFIADNLPEQGQLWDIDTWNGSSGEPDAHLSAAQREGDHAYSWYWCNLHEHIKSGRVVPMRIHSANGAETLGHLIEKGEMEKFDLIFIDGDHSETGIKTDVEAWLPLLKDGGLMCGHDYYKENEGPWWVFVRNYVEARFPNVQKTATSLWYVRPHAVVEHGNVYDCFLYNDEAEVLELRLATLYDVVDRFVLVEGVKTHSGLDKPLHFDLHKARFEKYLNKITHIVVGDYPTPAGNIFDQAWARERHQRDAIMHGLKDCKPNDIVLIGDADEIANPEAIMNYKPSRGVCRLKQRMFYYYLNCENKEGWDWHKIAPFSEVKRLTPCGIRYPPSEAPIIENGGWHFSFLGDAKNAIKKVQDYAHREFDTPELMNIERVSRLIEEGRDIFGRDLRYEFVEIDDTYPKSVRANEYELWKKHLVRDARRGHYDAEQMRDVEETVARWDASREQINRKYAMHKIGTVTASISTKDRYFTTLPLTISAVANQTIKPDKLKIYDDGEQRDLREFSPFNHLLAMLTEMGIDWEILKTPRMGQVANHQHALDNCTTEYLWRVDDDEVPTPDCLKELLKTFRDYGPRGGEPEKVGAVAGLVHHPGQVQPLPDFITGQLSDAQAGFNLQWYRWNGGQRETEHLYSTFLINVAAAHEAGGYPRELSRIGHREETIFSHRLKRAGYALVVTPHALTWHFRESTGGIRSFTDQQMWEHDEQVFQSYLKEWGMDNGRPAKMIVLDCGIGDHFAFKSVLPKLKEIHADKELILAVCYPEILKDEGLKLISIAEAQTILGPRYGESSVYKKLWDLNWHGSLAEGVLEVCK